MNKLNVANNQGTKSGLKSDELYEVIRDKICLLDYTPGTALREEALATEFGVSRTPIRRVLQRLEYEGLVTHNQGTGVIVTTIDLKQLKDVYELRLKLAEFAGEMMFSRIPDDVLNKLDVVREECLALRDKYDVRAIALVYHRFNEIMLGMISNRPLQQISEQLFYQTARVWLDILPELDWEHEVDIVYEEISDVISYLREGHMTSAANVRRDHMAMLLKRINRYLGSADDKNSG